MKWLIAMFTITLAMMLAFLYFTVGDIDARLTMALDAFGLWLKWIGILLLVAMALFALLALVIIQHKYRMRQLRPVDGAFPLQRKRLRYWQSDAPFLVALFQYLAGEELLINPNTMVGSAAIINRDGYRELEPSAGWANQVAVRQAVERTNAVRAMFPGDAARTDKYGSMSQMPRPTAAAMRLMDRTNVSRETLDAPIVPPARQITQTWTAKDVMRLNTDASFGLGISSENDIVAWDVESAPHLRVHGKSQGSGKTNLIKQIAVGVCRSGGHCIVLDRRGYKDWAAFSPYVELVDNRERGAFAGAMQQLRALYMQRDSLLGAAGVGNLAMLSNAPARVFVVISEFGSACRSAADSGELGAVVHALKSILSEAGAAGVHVIFEDQAVNRNWPPELRGNASPVTGYLPEDASKAGGYSKAHQLEQYEFHYDGERFKTFDMRVEAGALLAGCALMGPENYLINTASFLPSSRKNDFSPENGQKNTPNEEGRKEGSVEVGPTDLQRMIWAWRDAHPKGRQIDMIREFKTLGIEITSGYASKVWNREQEPVTLPTLLEQYGEIEIGGERVRQAVDKSTLVDYRNSR